MVFLVCILSTVFLISICLVHSIPSIHLVHCVPSIHLIHCVPSIHLVHSIPCIHLVNCVPNNYLVHSIPSLVKYSVIILSHRAMGWLCCSVPDAEPTVLGSNGIPPNLLVFSALLLRHVIFHPYTPVHIGAVFIHMHPASKLKARYGSATK